MITEKKRRVFMTIAGVLITGFSVGFFNFSLFGMDPFQVFAHGLWFHTSIGFGAFYTIVNLIMLIGIFFIDRKKIGLGTFINIFFLGYVVEFSSWLWVTLLPEPLMIFRIAALVIGIIVISFGAALYFTGDLGVSTYDAVAIILNEKGIAKFHYCRIATDLICVATGFFLGARVGVGTLVTALFMGPIIAFFNKTVAIPLRYQGNIDNRR